jgi:uncharacterized membrane protein
MNLHLHDWMNLLTRWTHLITGIAWIGSSFYFMWLDSHLTPPETLKPDVEGELWMTHSGGFYLVERKRIAAGGMPKTLHWFKYEALFTLISGLFLLGIVYYLNAGAYLVDPAISAISPAAAMALSVSILIGSWFIYDSLWQSPLGKKFPNAATAISLFLAAGAAVGFCHYLSGRAAFIHVGAMFGTIMVANVWVRILPAQQKMIDATDQGRTPDYSLSAQAKRRSVHNSYMTFPVLFMMLSNHYAITYGHSKNWVILILLIFLGAAIRHVMLARKGPIKNASKQLAAIAAGICFLTLLGLTATPSIQNDLTMQHDSSDHIPFQQVRNVIHQRCLPCHSTQPIDTTFGPSPGGVHFETSERIRALAFRIKVRAVDTKSMPLANKTGITEEERTLLGQWVDQGALEN